MTTSTGHDRRQATISAHVATALFSVTGVFGNLIHLPATQIVFGRVLVASLVLAAFRRGRLATSRRQVARFAISGVILAISWVTFFHAVQVSSVAIALISFSTFPLFSILLEWAISRSRMLLTDVLAAVLVIAGVVVISTGSISGGSVPQGVIWGTSSGLTYALLAVFNKRSVQGTDSWTIVFWQDAFAAVALLPFAIAGGVGPSGNDVLLLVLLGTAFTALSHSLFIGALKVLRSQTASVIGSLEPLYGSIVALFVLGEVPTGRTVAGGAVMLLGVISLVRAERQAATTS